MGSGPDHRPSVRAAALGVAYSAATVLAEARHDATAYFTRKLRARALSMV
jgi:hypothetical protein